MINGVVKSMQKFFNKPFRYDELLKICDSRKDFLLKEDVLNKISEDEYNALWDMLLHLEKFFLFANEKKFIIRTQISVLNIFNYYHEQRKL